MYNTHRMSEKDGSRQILLTPRELARLTEDNIRPVVLPAGTKVEVCLKKHGRTAIGFGAVDTPRIVGTFTLGSEVPIIVDSSTESGADWEMYLKPTSEALLRAGRVFDKLERTEEGATDEIIRLCKEGREYVTAGALEEIEARILRDNPDLTELMARAGLTTSGYDIVFHLKS